MFCSNGIIGKYVVCTNLKTGNVLNELESLAKEVSK